MGNLPLSLSLFRTEAKSEQVRGEKFIASRISSSITYYYTPISGTGDNPTCSAKECQLPTAFTPVSFTSPSSFSLDNHSSADPSSSSLSSDSNSNTPASSLNQSDPTPASRPLLLFLSWLGAQPGGVAKYRDLYLDRGMDVLVVRSNVMHFLWPRWGFDYGLEVLRVLEEPQFSKRAVLVHACSIGGYTFTQILLHIAQGQKKHAGLAQRVLGQIYDSLVVGSLEHMAIGLGKTLVPRFESLVKHAALLYFWLFKTHTADFYNHSISGFYNSPITAPALFFSSENDALCDQVAMDKVIEHWRKRGVTVECRKWKQSTHAAHLRCHPKDYLCTLEKFLNSLSISSLKAKMQTVEGGKLPA